MKSGPTDKAKKKSPKCKEIKKNRKRFVSVAFILHTIELILGVTALVLRLQAGDIVHPGTGREECVDAAFFGYFIVTIVVNVSFYVGECIDGLVMICAAFGGMIMYAGGAGICLGAHDYNHEYHPNHYALGAGAVGMLCAGIYYIDFLAHLLALLRKHR